MDYLGLKDSSRQLQANCAISYSFYLHLMLYACAVRFDVTENLENFWFLGGISTGPKRGLNRTFLRLLTPSDAESPMSGRGFCGTANLGVLDGWAVGAPLLKAILEAGRWTCWAL